MLQQVISLALVAALTAPTPTVSQGIPAGASISGKVVVRPVTKVFVANPYIAYTTLADSTAAALIGNAMRDKLDGKLGSDLQVINRRDMNLALTNYGYSPDAILSLPSATRLGREMEGRIIITSTLTKSGGFYTVSARVLGRNDDAGEVVRNTQVAGQPLPDFGSKTAELIIPVIKALNDAKSCYDQVAAGKPDKAADAANKALKAVPSYGLAEMCLATMALKQDSVGKDAITHLQNAVKGDPSSLIAWSLLGVIHQKLNDSTAAVADYQAMLREDPTNNELAKKAVDVFRKYHQQDALNQLVEQQLKLDPTNTDWYDLKANGCIQDNKYDCALDAMNQIWTMDSTRADTNFFAKVIFIAQSKNDTTASLKWSRMGAKRYDDNAYMVSSFARALVAAGKPDSAIDMAVRVLMIDSTQADQALLVVKDLVDAKKFREASRFAAGVSKYGTESTKDQFASMLANPGLELAKVQPIPPADDTSLTAMGNAVLSSGTINPQLLTVGHYLVAAPMLGRLAPLSQSVRADKSCDEVTAYETFLNALLPHLDAMAAGPVEGLANYAKPILDPVKGEIGQIPTLRKNFCNH